MRGTAVGGLDGNPTRGLAWATEIAESEDPRQSMRLLTKEEPRVISILGTHQVSRQ